MQIIDDFVCKKHGETQQRIVGIENELKYIPELMSFKNRILGFGFLLTLILGGGFTYTYFAHADIAIINNEHSDMKTNIAITNERYQNLNAKLITIDEKLTELIKLKIEGKEK